MDLYNRKLGPVRRGMSEPSTAIPPDWKHRVSLQTRAGSGPVKGRVRK